ncbi:hypothetical protein ABZ135_22015 [Streptomyces sp. NPDC006339]|uniref:hypothetical protein n=1 Tax=Streptomyces sp. NPDC006339 TaxID=3156755 RepID=UPI0033A4934F
MSFWLAGMRITPARLNKYQSIVKDTTAGRTTTSTTYGNLSGGALATSVIVPASGAVDITIRATGRNPTNNGITSYLAVGSSSGTVYSPSDAEGVIVAATGSNQPQMIRDMLTGLVPGETLTVTTQHRVNTASTATYDYRCIILEGLG